MIKVMEQIAYIRVKHVPTHRVHETFKLLTYLSHISALSVNNFETE